jgi:hypothetical protein
MINDLEGGESLQDNFNSDIYNPVPAVEQSPVPVPGTWVNMSTDQEK